MRIILAAMPWHSIDTPSLALGILHERVKHCKDKHEVIDVYAHLNWADYLTKRSGGKLKSTDYTQVTEGGIFQGLGDWIFTPALYGTTEWKVEEYTAYLKKVKDKWSDWLLEMHRWSPDFINQIAQQLVAAKPDVVGLTSTFMQNVASLAVARRIKQLAPHVKTVMGGANCDGPQGLAVHRNYPFIDLVVRGEGEQAFVEMLDALNGHGELKDILGLCWRTPDGKHVANEERTHAFPAQQIPVPNYDAYFKTLERSQVRGEFEPKLVMEGARGCWWGEKHHCTFCGLNGSLMVFRSKPPEQMLNEIRQMVDRYQMLDIIMVDNIIDLKYFKGLLPHVIRDGLSLRVHYEVKSNLTADQIQVLKDAGVVFVQPGIENLNSHVLKLMQKGISGCHNVNTLRDCEEQGLTIAWNYLYGFPGETEEDYADIIAQMPAMVHLMPPSNGVRIALERFSPNFENPAFGFTDRSPASFYPIIYDLPKEELMELAYIFETPAQGLKGELPQQLRKVITAWHENYSHSELSFRDDGKCIYIRDRRVNWTPTDHVLEAPHEVALHRLLRRPQSPTSASEALTKVGHSVTAEEVARKLAEWRKLGLVFEEGGRFLGLALRDVPHRIRLLSAEGRKQAERPRGLPQAPSADSREPEMSLAAFAAGEGVKDMRLNVRMPAEAWGSLAKALDTRPPGPAIALSLEGSGPSDWPTTQQLARAVSQGVMEVRVPWDMELGPEKAAQSAEFIRFLRDCTAYRVKVNWQGSVLPQVRSRALHHLLPPTLNEVEPPVALRTWSESHSYGLCYWRSGPGFMVIKDKRAGQGEGARFTLENGPLRDIFTQLAEPKRWEQLKDIPDIKEVLDSLQEEDLVLKLDDWFVALPYQIRHWPVPAQAI